MQNVKSILLIDDDRDDNEFHQIVISHSGLPARVNVISDSRKALACWEKNMQDPEHSKVPDVVFLDINMPAITGFELLERVKKIPDPLNLKSRMKIYILSTSPPDDESCEGRNEMVCGYYQKPLTAEILAEVFSKN